MSEHYTKGLILKGGRIDRLHAEGVRVAARGDIARLEAIREEMAVLVESLEDIREEQLISQLPKPKRPSFWRRLTRSSVAGETTTG